MNFRVSLNLKLAIVSSGNNLSVSRGQDRLKYCDLVETLICVKSIAANIYQEFYKRKKACSS